MLPDDFNAHRLQLEAATARLNAGAPIPQVEPEWIEHMWDVMQRIPPGQRQSRSIGLGAIAVCDPSAQQIPPDQQLAVMARSMLLQTVMQFEGMEDYLKDETQRKRVFLAAATSPCNKDQFGEALVRRHLVESAPEAAEKEKQKLRQLGYDPDYPTLGSYFLDWLRDHC